MEHKVLLNIASTSKLEEQHKLSGNDLIYNQNGVGTMKTPGGGDFDQSY